MTPKVPSLHRKHQEDTVKIKNSFLLTFSTFEFPTGKRSKER